MNLQHICNLFSHHQSLKINLQKICFRNRLKITKGYRMLVKARKYRRPEDLEDPFYYGVGPRKNVQAAFQSLSTRGFGKEISSYNPAADVEEKFFQLCKKVFGSQLNENWRTQALDDRVLKYKLLTKGMETFGKDVPNSTLHKLQHVGDVLEFFKVAVDGSYHWDKLNRDSDHLPQNVHLLQDTPRFNPETDTFFDGVTAYPGRRRTVYTKTKEMFEKIIQWPNV